jgi:tripartite-type tricarboxylate transporter receptor subunit TctC
MTSFPELPTMNELGLKDLETLSWNGVLAPAGTPPAVVQKLQNELIRIVNLPDVRERFASLAADPVGSTSAEFSKIIETELARWTAVAKAGNIKITP